MLARSLLALAAPTALAASSSISAAAPPPAAAAVALVTPWTSRVDPEAPLPEHPRPLLERERWRNLNGRWSYAISAGDVQRMPEPSGAIVVPFPMEARLSGVQRPLEPEERLWYRRTFEIPESWRGGRVLLHFGAVDWETDVWVNGTPIAEWLGRGREAHPMGDLAEVARSPMPHRGGYDPFALDITEALRLGAVQELTVAVRDPTDAGSQPRGKQVRRPESIWYTRNSGIWQTVWLEAVPALSLANLEVEATLDPPRFALSPILHDARGDRASTPLLRVRAIDESGIVAQSEGPATATLVVPIASPQPWSPSRPHLYRLEVELSVDGAVVDRATSWAGLRTVQLVKDEDGIQRLGLNGAPLFQFGPLDQGFWPDGLMTAPVDEALRFDVEAVLRMGGNMLRKHVKVEPERFYHWCDRLGVLVWQDMPSGANPEQPPDARRQFESELAAMIAARRGHPCIVMWVPFNEGWGQYDTERITAMVQALDPGRMVNNASGWTDAGVGSVLDIHAYPGPALAPPPPERASVLGEFGGLGLPMAGHLWAPDNNWGYVKFRSREELTAAYVELLAKLPELIAKGLSAAVYTQTSDVEIEVNGWLTYDRQEWKIDPAQASAAARAFVAARPEQGRSPASQSVPPSQPSKAPPAAAAPAAAHDGDGPATLRTDRLYHGLRRPVVVSIEPAPPPGASIDIVLLDHSGGALGRASRPDASPFDLGDLVPEIWMLDRTAFLQLLVNDAPSGSALVVQPLLNRQPVRTAEALRPDGKTPYTRIIGWGDDLLDPENPEHQKLKEAWKPGEPVVMSGVRTYPERDVLLETSMGDILVALRPDDAPNTAWNFRHLAERGFYDGTPFHRVVPLDRAGRPFVIQGGDPTSTGDGGPGWDLPFERSNLPHDFGVVSMARGDAPDSAGSQFFIALSREGTARLDTQYCAFGEVVDGAKAIIEISGVEIEDPATGRPVTMPVVNKATLRSAPPRVPGRGRPDARVERPVPVLESGPDR